jgi:methylated-DNA-protein-cysteine methyltransferase related protein
MTENIYVKAVNAIPKGETRCFGEIAILAGKPKAPRAAGRVLSSYPTTGKAAWHRAVTTRGSLSIDPERARIQLERLRREGARPREDETVAKWAKRVGANFVGDYRSGLYVEVRHPRLNKFDPLFVERLESETAGVDRLFEHVDDREIRQRDEAAADKVEANAQRRAARTSTKKKARR